MDASTGAVCVNVASMSRYLEESEARPAYKCKACLAKAAGALGRPGPASPPRRGLWVYPTVRGVDGEPTPPRVPGPLRLLVHVPPATWVWDGVPAARGAAGTPALPVVRQSAWRSARRDVPPSYYEYSAEMSKSIWLPAPPYATTSPDSCAE